MELRHFSTKVSPFNRMQWVLMLLIVLQRAGTVAPVSPHQNNLNTSHLPGRSSPFQARVTVKFQRWCSKFWLVYMVCGGWFRFNNDYRDGWNPGLLQWLRKSIQKQTHLSEHIHDCRNCTRTQLSVRLEDYIIVAITTRKVWGAETDQVPGADLERVPLIA